MVIWLSDLIYTISPSISTIAFDTDLVIKKNIQSFYIVYVLYMIREMEHSFLRRQFSTALHQKYFYT